jgi:sugar phosphate isomerase/epimerase
MKIHVNVPYKLLIERIHLIKKYKINPEIYFNNNELDEINWNELRYISENLNEEGLQMTIHAPYMDLSPGGIDRKIRAITKERFFQIIDISECLKPKIIIFHPGYDKWSFNHNEIIWLENSLDIWSSLGEKAANMGISLAIENMYEEEPEIFLSLFKAIGNKAFGFCFDIGHFNIFSKVPLSEWIDKLGGYIIEIHVHDNNKKFDEHLPLGNGNVDFKKFFILFNKLKINPVFTIEPHREEDLWSSLYSIQRYLKGGEL